jgi:hypothetical protein
MDLCLIFEIFHPFDKKNTIAEDNMKKARQITVNNPISPFGFVELDGNTMSDENTIPTILSLLTKGVNVCYKPRRFEPSDYTKILTYGRTNLEIVFFPEMNNTRHILKPSIDLKKPILFRVIDKKNIGENKVIDILSMFKTLDDLSEYLNYGSYQIISRIRIGYVFSDKNRKTESAMKGGNKKQEFIQDYESGLVDMYPQILQDQKTLNSSLRKSSKHSSPRKSSKHSSSRKKAVNIAIR